MSMLQIIEKIFGTSCSLCEYRLFDSDKVKNLVTKWVTFYKTYRDILTSDIVHVRRPDMQGMVAAAHSLAMGYRLCQCE